MLITDILKARNLHVILADDDEDDRQFFREAIYSIAPSVKLSTAKDGEELISKLRKNINELPDLIFLDVNMPCKNGLECLQEIKSNNFLKDIPVMIYSTSTSQDYVETMYRNGAARYIQKPVCLDGIIRLLKMIFSRDLSNWFCQPTREKFIIK